MLQLKYKKVSIWKGLKGVEQLTIRLSKDDMQKIRAIAKTENRSINFIINQFIADKLKGGN